MKTLVNKLPILGDSVVNRVLGIVNVPEKDLGFSFVRNGRVSRGKCVDLVIFSVTCYC